MYRIRIDYTYFIQILEIALNGPSWIMMSLILKVKPHGLGVENLTVVEMHP